MSDAGYVAGRFRLSPAPRLRHAEIDLSYERGYEWRLMVEARKRNPSILLSGLAWTFPGWIGAGTSSPWTNVTLTASYIVAWLEGARGT